MSLPCRPNPVKLVQCQHCEEMLTGHQIEDLEIYPPNYYTLRILATCPHCKTKFTGNIGLQRLLSVPDDDIPDYRDLNL